MKRAVLLGTAMLTGLLLQGCPIFPEEPYGCDSSAECGDGFRCDILTGTCEAIPYPIPGSGGSSGIRFCSMPSDCGYSETCTRAGVCLVGDCTATGYGCVEGYVCDAVAGRWACVPTTLGSGGGTGTGGSPPSGGAGGDPTQGGASGAVSTHPGGYSTVGGAGGEEPRGAAGTVSSAGAGGAAGMTAIAGSPSTAGAPTAGAPTAGGPSTAGAPGTAGAPSTAGAPASAGAPMTSTAGVAGTP